MTMTAAMGIVLFSRSRSSSFVNCRLSLAVVLFNLCININFLAGRNRMAPKPIDEIQYHIVIVSKTKNPHFLTSRPTC